MPQELQECRKQLYNCQLPGDLLPRLCQVAPSLQLCLKQQAHARGRSRRPTQQPAALTWDTGSLCVSSVRPVRQSNGSSGRLMSHTSTSPLYSPPGGPSRPGQELTHAHPSQPRSRMQSHFPGNHPDEGKSRSPGLALSCCAPPQEVPPAARLRALLNRSRPQHDRLSQNTQLLSPLTAPRGCLLLPASHLDQAAPLHGPRPLKTQLRTCLLFPQGPHLA